LDPRAGPHSSPRLFNSCPRFQIPNPFLLPFNNSLSSTRLCHLLLSPTRNPPTSSVVPALRAQHQKVCKSLRFLLFWNFQITMSARVAALAQFCGRSLWLDCKIAQVGVVFHHADYKPPLSRSTSARIWKTPPRDLGAALSEFGWRNRSLPCSRAARNTSVGSSWLVF
jgi:hypothetical protein